MGSERFDPYATGVKGVEGFPGQYSWLNCWHSAWVGKSGAGKTSDVINKLLRMDLPYYHRYSHFYIFSDQVNSTRADNPWLLLKNAIKTGLVDGGKFTFLTKLSKQNINKIQRREKGDKEALMIVDDKADELGRAPFSLIDARKAHGLH